MPTPHPQSALIVPVPEAEPYVAHLRRRFDPAAREGVPAHITLLIPFVAPERIDDIVLDGVRAVLAASPAFDFRLASIARFPGCTYLVPEPSAPFVALTRALVRRFPECPPYGGAYDSIIPHLTVAQTDDIGQALAEADLRRSLAERNGIDSFCGEVALIENSSGRWRPMQSFALSAPKDGAR
jgi:2'-5' RNA ligase